jgi:UDP-N-acetylglucosamine/UDP-N-acetylgalactosamine diphosphorylase
MNLKIRQIISKKLIKKLNKSGNEHVLYFWNELKEEEKRKLLDDLNKVDFKKIKKYYYRFQNRKFNNLCLSPTEYFSIEKCHEKLFLKKIGEKALFANHVAFLTVAGGQGSRLDYNHPKGCYPVSPVKNKSLFQIFAEKIKYYSTFYNKDFYWLIMTSLENNEETEDFFKKNNYFRLKKDQIIFFTQGLLPSLTLDGRLILETKFSIYKNPDGHGGVIKALYKNGLLKFIKKSGIKYLVYFQVDNPLVDMCDPYFIGYHIFKKSEISTKVIEKQFPEEKLGIICKKNNKKGIVEYSDLKKKIMYEKDDAGKLKYLMGSIAIHIFNVDFLIRCSKNMKIHHAIKKVEGYSFDGEPVIKDMDALKFESFVFDVIPMARGAVFYETKRDEEFYPLKNKTGVDSIQTCKDGQNNLFKSWLNDSGLIKNDKLEGKIVEISPLFAPNKELFLKEVENNVEKINKFIFDEKGNVNDKIYIE